MSNTAVLATILHCVFSPPGHESGPEKLIGVLNVRMDEATAASVASGQPPVSTAIYSGEPTTQREWSFAGSEPNEAGEVNVVRVVTRQDFSNPYAFQMGKSTKIENQKYKFEPIVKGVCSLMSESDLPEGERQ